MDKNWNPEEKYVLQYMAVILNSWYLQLSAVTFITLLEGLGNNVLRSVVISIF